MGLWFDEFTAERAHKSNNRGLNKTLGMEILERGEDFLKGRIPVDERTHQPFGILHGGASCVLAETLASFASAMVIDHTKQSCVGLEINANHLRGVKSGWVTGTARPIHIGRTTHVWDVRLVDDQGKLTCISRVTMAILDGSRGPV